MLFFQDYLAHIIDMGNLPIRPEQVCDLFGNIEDIYEFNRWVTPTNTYKTQTGYGINTYYVLGTFELNSKNSLKTPSTIPVQSLWGNVPFLTACN